jgi:hypothetical protein
MQLMGIFFDILVKRKIQLGHFLFSVLRQFKIVKLTPATSQGKKQTSFRKQNCLCMLYGRQT